MNFRKFRKSAKALSPVIATIILIAVTVAVSVVVAAWMGALTIGFMGNSEQASITNVALANANGGSTVTCTIQNTGSSTITVNSGNVDGNSSWAIQSSVSIPKGGTGTVTLVDSTDSAYFTVTAQYTIKLQTAKGNSLTTQASYTGA